MEEVREAGGAMVWVTHLPEVGDQILKERENIVALLQEANRIESLASELRSKAYRAALSLESRIIGVWPTEEIAAARVGRQG